MPSLSQEIVARSGNREIRAAEFWTRVNALIAMLDGDTAERCALVCESAANLAAGLVALGYLGRTTIVPPAPSAGSLESCEAAVDLVVTDLPDSFTQFRSLIVPESEQQQPALERTIKDDSPIEFYTSGSSDQPECVRQCFAMLRRELQELEREWGAQLGDATVVGTVPHCHRFGLLVSVFWPLIAGRSFYDRSCPTPTVLREAVGPHQCVIISSPAFLKRAAGTADLPAVGQVRALFSSGAPLPDGVAEQLASEWGQAPIEIYGSTETGGIAWRSWSSREQRARWHPLKRAEIELRPGDAGDQLWVRTPYTVDWMSSGDLARRDVDGGFQLLGRTDSVVKIEDRRVSLNEMRDRLVAHPWIADTRLLVLTGPRTQIGAVAILDEVGRSVLASSGKSHVRDNLRAWLNEVYARSVVPRKWRFVDQWPDNEMGKVTRASLQSLFETGT